MGYDVMSVERKMKVLKTQFMHCYKLYKKYSINGESYQPKWFAYNSLKFLIPGKIYRENREISRMQEQGLHLVKTEPLDITQEEILVEDHEEHTNPTDSHLRQIPPPNVPIPSDSNGEGSHFHHRNQEERIPKDVPGNIRDEYTIFGELIACRLRKIQDPRTRLTVQFNITNLMFDAEMQELNGSSNVTPGPIVNGIGKI